MINKDKYLRDGVSAEEFVKDYINYCKRKKQDSVNLESLSLFLETEETPTLTEDERVILRNIDKKYHYIGRGVYGESEHPNLYVSSLTEAQGWTNFYAYDYLFQFIKERRRILY